MTISVLGVPSTTAERTGLEGVLPNDNFADATDVAVRRYRSSLSTANATVQTHEPTRCHDESPYYSWGADMTHTIWYRLTPATSGTVYVSTLGSYFNTAVAAYTGATLESLQQIACDDDDHMGYQNSDTLRSRMRFEALAGVTYHIQVGGDHDAGDLVLEIAQTAGGSGPPPNDDASGAVRVARGVSFPQSIRGATTTWAEPDGCETDASSVWFTYTSAEAGAVSFDTFGSWYDTTIAVYRYPATWAVANYQGMMLAACNSEAYYDPGYDLDIGPAGGQSRVEVSVETGETLYVQVGADDTWYWDYDYLRLNVR